MLESRGHSARGILHVSSRVTFALAALAFALGAQPLAVAQLAVPARQAVGPNAGQPPALDPERLERAFARAAELPRLQALVVARRGIVRAEQRFHGPSLDAPINIKSISKSFVSALVGIAISQGRLSGVDQPIGPFFARTLKRQPDPRVARITIGQLLSMQSGLVRTSGPAYGSWVASRNWIDYVLTAPLLSDPGGPMVYSTGNSHVLSAILTQATRRSTYDYARTELAKPLGIQLQPWTRDPQGIYFGGNQMRVSAHGLVRFGELYRNHGRVGDKQVVPAAWVDASWTPRTRSIFSGQLYGYGWFIAKAGEHPLYFAWGYGGQFIFVIPDLELTVVTTSAPNGPRDFEHLGEIYGLLLDDIVPAAEAVPLT
jgi:CubicO group peptidase (beta-lactamase class C family)